MVTSAVNHDMMTSRGLGLLSSPCLRASVVIFTGVPHGLESN
jgi:hypothetical protein